MKIDLPLSKSWAIRMIFLDMLYGKETKYKVLNHFKRQDKRALSEDVAAALDCAIAFISGKNTFKVRNSGTVCRFLMYVLDGNKYKIIRSKQLAKRSVIAPKNFSMLSVKELLSLGTSQFASAALLVGKQPIKNLPAKCRLSVQARKAYFKNKGRWIPKTDEVIARQINHFLYGGKFKPLIAEDYCYARAFNLITKKEGKRLWPELANHESDRLKVMEEACTDLNKKIRVHEDHRAAMAVALRQKSLGLPVRVDNKKCVAKSWPLFWEWLENI